MRVLYQNSETGELFDLTRRVTGCRWETRLTGSPGRVELAVLRDGSLSWSPGGVVQVYGEENEGLFHGYLFSAAAGEGEEVSLTAYDQLRYLKNKDTYVFTGLRADQIAGRIAADFRLSTGALENTGYVIPSLVADGESLLDIILGALETTLDQTGKRFFLWDDFGKLRLSAAPAAGGSPVVLGEGSLLTGYTHTVEIDTDSCNTVKLVREEKDSASRAVWYGQNAQAAARWGCSSTGGRWTTPSTPPSWPSWDRPCWGSFAGRGAPSPSPPWGTPGCGRGAECTSPWPGRAWRGWPWWSGRYTISGRGPWS